LVWTSVAINAVIRSDSVYSQIDAQIVVRENGIAANGVGGAGGDRNAWTTVKGDLVGGLRLRAADRVTYCVSDRNTLINIWQRSSSSCVQSDIVSLNEISDRKSVV